VTLKGSLRIGDEPIFLKNSAPHFLMTTYRMNLLSARSISLDNTFKRPELFISCKKLVALLRVQNGQIILMWLALPKTE
jgi:hypothetical protein